MKNDQADAIGTILQQLLKERGLNHRLIEAALPDLWREVVGPAAGRVSEVQQCRYGSLRVEVTASVWRAELLLRKEEIRRKINERIGEEFVKEIVLK